MTRPDVHIDPHLVLLRDGGILMGDRRNVEFGAGQYQVPAGHLEVPLDRVEAVDEHVEVARTQWPRS